MLVGLVDNAVVATADSQAARPLDAEADAAACATLHRSARSPARHRCSGRRRWPKRAAHVRAALAAEREPDLAALAGRGHWASVIRPRRRSGAVLVPGWPARSWCPASCSRSRARRRRDALPRPRVGRLAGSGHPARAARRCGGRRSSPMQLVQNINRCPEVTTTAPKRARRWWPTCSAGAARGSSPAPSTIRAG